MSTIFHAFFRILLLLIIELFLLRNIHFGPWLAPMIYPYLIFRMSVKTSAANVMIAGFLIGLTIDLFLHSGGVNAFALTLAASVRKPMLRFFLTPEEWDTNLNPGIYKPDIRRFISSAFLFLIIHQIGYQFMAGSFFGSPFRSIGYVLVGSFFSLLLFIAVEAATQKPKRR